MKTDFLLAITQLAAERNLPKEVVFSAVEKALVSAFKKDDVTAQQDIVVKIHPVSGDVRVYVYKTVVSKITDPNREITLANAKKIKKDVKVGETIIQETTPLQAGRIAAQTAKQVVLQRLREAEREFIFGEYVDREGDILSGVVQRIEPKQIVVDLGKTEGIIPATEQVRTEHYRIGQRLKLYLLEVNRTNKGPRLILSRSHPNLVKRLFELEVPEIHSGIVEIKEVAREPGFRSKIAVAARQDGIDAVGSCVGLRGVRIQNVTNELDGERIDVIEWDARLKTFIANALSPAQVVRVDIREDDSSAVVVVPDGQLSLAIGKEGQNARLAARLTGWRIDIKSASLAKEEEKAAVVKKQPVTEVVEEPVAAKIPLTKSVTAEHYEIPLDHLPLSPRTLNILHSAGINNIGELLELGEENWIQIRGFGQKSLTEVRESISMLEIVPKAITEEKEIELDVTKPLEAEEKLEVVEKQLGVIGEVRTEVAERAEKVLDTEIVEALEDEAEEEEEDIVFYEPPVKEEIAGDMARIRFAEDIFGSDDMRYGGRKKGKKKRKSDEKDAAGPKKKRKVQAIRTSEDVELDEY